MSNPSITFREYNPSTGAFIGNISALSFGRIAAGTHSRIKVVDVAFTGVEAVTNVRVGVTANGGVTVNDSPTGVVADGSAANGGFGIMHTPDFNPTYAAGPLTLHFAGLNSDGTPTNPFNVNVGTRDDTTSQFIYLDIQPGSNNTGVGGAMYKVFFDFS